MGRIASRIGRLCRMGPQEIGFRGWQWVGRIEDRRRHARLREGAPGEVTSSLCPESALEPWVEAARRLVPGLAAGPASVHRWAAGQPIPGAVWIAEADAALEGRFDLLGVKGLEWGWPPAWEKEPLHGVESVPTGYCWSIDPLDEAVVGDVKVVWELHRLQWLVRMALAWHSSGEDRWVEAVGCALDDWLDRFPPLHGLPWSSALEVAFRGFSLTWLTALCGAHWLNGHRQRLQRIRWIVHASRRHVARNLSTYFAPNTHLLGELLWLGCSGLIWGEQESGWMKDGRRWLNRLERAADQQTGVDGLHDEQSVLYHRYAVEFYLQALLTLRACGRMDDPLAVRFSLRSRRMLEASMRLFGPDILVPAWGDDDGGRLWPWVVGRGSSWGWEGLFELGRRLGLVDFGAALQEGPEVVLLLGVEGVRDAPAGTGGEDGSMQSMAVRAKASGWASLQAGSSAALRVGFACGPVGPRRTRAGHGHEDVGSFVLWRDGKPWVVDRGTGDYLAAGRRAEFRDAASHNLIAWDGRGRQAVGEGMFQRESWVEGWLHDCGRRDGAAWTSGTRPWLAGRGCSHRALVLLNDALLVLDGVTGLEGREVGTWRVQLPSAIGVSLGSEGGLILTGQAERARLSWHGPLFLHGEGGFAPRGWSPAYGCYEEGTVIWHPASAGRESVWGLAVLCWHHTVSVLERSFRHGMVSLLVRIGGRRTLLAWRPGCGPWSHRLQSGRRPPMADIEAGLQAAGWPDPRVASRDAACLSDWLERVRVEGHDRGGGCAE